MKTIKQAAKEFAESEIMETYDSIIEELKRISFIHGAEFAQQWISVDDELPEANINVLAKCGKTYWTARLQPHGKGLTLYCIKGSRYSEEFEATHWRPIERE